MDNRRKYYRNKTKNVVILIDGEAFLAVDWSPDGFSINYPKKHLDPKAEIRGEIDIFQGNRKGQFTGTVIRHGDDDMLAVQFTGISSESFLLLCTLVNNDENED